MEGVDYSWARPDTACLAANGKQFAVRYVGTTASGKNLTPSEVNRLRAAGIDLVAVYQTTASFMFSGAHGGTAASKAIADATACGIPADRPVYFALDSDPRGLSRAEWLAVVLFLDQAAAAIGRNRIGVYGGHLAMENLVPHVAPFGWQTYGWSAGRLHPRAHLYQYRNGVALCGGTLDLCRALQPDFGQWGHTATQPDSEDDDMQPFLHADPWTGIHYVDASGATWLATDDEVRFFLGRRLPVEDWSAIGERFNVEYIKQRQAGADEAILDQEVAQTMYLAAINTRDEAEAAEAVATEAVALSARAEPEPEDFSHGLAPEPEPEP